MMTAAPAGIRRLTVAEADDRGDAERAREDRRVIGAAPRVGGKAQDARPIELGDHRRRELVGDQHARRIEVLEQVPRPALLAAQVHPQPPCHVVQIALALVKVGILDVVEDGGNLVERALDRPFRVDALL